MFSWDSSVHFCTQMQKMYQNKCFFPHRCLNLEALKLFYFELQWLWDYVHENERKISFRMVLRIPSGMVWSPSYDRFCVFIHFHTFSCIFSFVFHLHVNFKPPGKGLSPHAKSLSPERLVVLTKFIPPVYFWNSRFMFFLLYLISIDFPFSLDLHVKNTRKSIGKPSNNKLTWFATSHG